MLHDERIRHAAVYGKVSNKDGHAKMKVGELDGRASNVTCVDPLKPQSKAAINNGLGEGEALCPGPVSSARVRHIP